MSPSESLAVPDEAFGRISLRDPYNDHNLGRKFQNHAAFTFSNHQLRAYLTDVIGTPDTSEKVFTKGPKQSAKSAR